MSSGSTEEEPRYALSFSLKSPSKQNTPGSPIRPCGDSCPLTRSIFYISLKFLIKIPLNKKIYHFSQRPMRVSLHFSQKRGPCGNRCPFPEPYLACFRGHQQRSTPPSSPRRAPSERGIPFLEPSFIHLSMSPLYEPPSRFPSGAPTERDSHPQSLLYITFRVLRKGSPPPPCVAMGPLWREIPVSKAFST